MRLVVALVATALLAACASPSAAPTPVPTAVSTAAVPSTARPSTPAAPPASGSATPSATVDPTTDPGEIEDAFLSDVDNLIAEATDLAVTPCDDLVMVVLQNPQLVPSLRGYAATVKRVSANQAVLNTDAVKSAVADLDKTMGQLEGALNLCGITTQRQTP